MPKVDGHPRDAASPSGAESPDVKSRASSSSSTIQDDIPPVHVLEAAQNQDRKETEDLLAGFDRPGRSPKPSSPEREFVDYYAKKKGSGHSGPDSGRPTSSAPPAPVVEPRAKQADVSTVAVPRKSAPMPAWLGWGAAALMMLVIGGAVAYLATGAERTSSPLPRGPSAATTITAATPVPQALVDNVPPPDPSGVVVEPQATAPSDPPRGSARREPKAVPGASASAGVSVPRAVNASATANGNANEDPKKPPPRDDFIRDM